MKALQTSQHLRFRPTGLITSGARLTLLILVTGIVFLGQAWQVAHRYGRHTASLPAPPTQAAFPTTPQTSQTQP